MLLSLKNISIMYYFKTVFHILYELRKNQNISDFDINRISYPKDYLINQWKSPALHRFIITYKNKDQDFEFCFNSDYKKDLKQELLNQIQDKEYKICLS